MAGGASRVGAVAIELLADGDRASDVRLDSGHAGGGAVWKPRIRSMIQTPRITGDVVVPLAVTLSTLACVRARRGPSLSAA